MTASIADPLLAGANVADSEVGTAIKEVDATGSSKPASDRKRYFVATWLSLTSLGLLGLARVYYSPLTSPKLPGTHLLQGWGDASCYTPTGGTCMVENCNAERGAVCSSDHNCVCAHGCTGADGICRNISSYSLVAKNVRFRNVKWPDQYLYAPRTFFMEQLRTTSSKGKFADLWNVYKMPGVDFIYGQEMFLLSPVEFPEYAAGVADTKMEAYIPLGDKKGGDSGGVTIPIGSMFVVSLYHLTSRHLVANRFPFNIAFVMNTLCRPPSHPEAVEINGALGRASWYIHHASWEVFGWVWSDPEPGGYWVPDPPLNIPLKTCGK